MTEEQQGPTLGIRLREVSILWQVKENDWKWQGPLLGAYLRECYGL